MVFKELETDRLYLKNISPEDNEKSIKLVEKYGFIYKGKMKDEIFRGEKYPHKIFTLDNTAV